MTCQCAGVTQGLLEILSSASEFDDLAIRPGEEEAVRKLLMHAPVAVDKPRYTDPHTKANALLQARLASIQCRRHINPRTSSCVHSALHSQFLLASLQHVLQGRLHKRFR